MVHVWVSILMFSLISAEAGANSFTQSMIMARSLEDNAEFQYALSDFSVKFAKCQYVKMYDDDLAENVYSDTVLARRHFVVFKLCPADDCSKCNTVYGDYVLEVDDYLAATVEYQTSAWETMCTNCNDDECGALCYMVENLAANGYVDASAYVQCQKLQNRGSDADDGEPGQLYIGPQCSSDGTSIIIGLFTDEECVAPYTTKDVEVVLGYKLSYHILENTYKNGDSDCVTCKEDSSGGNANDNADADSVSEMCEQIYSASAKCESKHGLTSGLVNSKRKEGQYNNQVENEFLVCNFIDSLIWNSYTEAGEINYLAVQDEIIRVATPLQKGMLTMLSVSLVLLFLYGFILDRQIHQLTPPLMQYQGEVQMT